MLNPHKLKVYEKALPARMEATQGRELLSRIIAMLSGFEGPDDFMIDKVSDKVSDKGAGPGVGRHQGVQTPSRYAFQRLDRRS